MFGYVTVSAPELKVKDLEKYKAYYCGLCRAMGTRHGFLSRLGLTYDMTFLIVLLTSLYECETQERSFRCELHPVKKRPMLQNEITNYAADMNLLLVYYHLQDDWVDEKKITALLASRWFRHKIKKIEKKYPRQCKVIKSELHHLSCCETQGITQIDPPAGCFGRIMEEIFVYKKDHWEERLRRIGLYLGKFIYIMDAYEDMERDQKEGRYNPLQERFQRREYEEECRQMLCLMIGECAAEFERLPCLLDVDILRNILYDGVWNRYRKIQDRKSEEQS